MSNVKRTLISAVATFVKAFVAQATLAGFGVGGVVNMSGAQRAAVSGGVAVLEFASSLAVGWLTKHPTSTSG